MRKIKDAYFRQVLIHTDIRDEIEEEQKKTRFQHFLERDEKINLYDNCSCIESFSGFRESVSEEEPVGTSDI
jgi:hypothetical protein